MLRDTNKLRTLRFDSGLEIVVDGNNKIVASNKPEFIGYKFVDKSKWMGCRFFEAGAGLYSG